MLPDQQPDVLSVSAARQVAWIEMACREGISDPSSASLAVTKTKDISCDCASQLLSRLKNCCHHVSAVSLVVYSRLKTCCDRVSVTRLVKIAVTLRHVYRLLDIRHWAHLRRVVAAWSRTAARSIVPPTNSHVKRT